MMAPVTISAPLVVHPLLLPSFFIYIVSINEYHLGSLTLYKYSAGLELISYVSTWLPNFLLTRY